jgi:tryptophan-rich sensory protein
MSRKRQALGLAGWIFATFIASVVGGLASVQAPTFYGALNQPAWAPPSWLFGPVWTVLYVMIAVAAWLVWRRGGFRANRLALGLFLLQLSLNALWTWMFFAWQLGALSFFEIVLLWLTVLATLIAFWKSRPLAGWLLVPYLAWVSFAAALNFSLWQLNPQILG